MDRPGEQRPLRVFIYAQHLSGVGHMVRSQRIGLALAEHHRVLILDGGRPLPFPSPLEPVTVPALVRRDGELAPLHDKLSLARVFALRRECLRARLADEHPDVVLIEHYPFSKWELTEEIENLLEHARQLNPAVKVIGSLRDVSLRTRHEASHEYEHRVLQLLARHFHGLLVHADPALCQLSDYFSSAADIEIPVIHTGIVAAPTARMNPDERRQRIGSADYLVASAGGGADRAQLLTRVVMAWRHLAKGGSTGQRKLLLFSGLEGCPAAIRKMIEGEPSILNMGFDPHFRHWLQDAVLSISCAGYNTCANLLASRTPALLLPNPTMSDQQERTRLLTGCGIAQSVPPVDAAGEDPLATLIAGNLGHDITTHSIRLDGAAQSARCIENWVSGLAGQ